MRVIVTRPPAQAVAWVQALQGLGVDAVALPLLGIGPPDDPAPVHAAWWRLGDYRLVTFVSPNAVQHFFDLRPPEAVWPEGTAAGSTGPGTSAALREHGIAEATIVEPAADAPSFDSEALWSRIAAWSWVGQRALVVRGEDGRDWLAATLRERGAEVSFVAAYRRLQPQLGPGEQELLARALAEPDHHLWLFSSSEAVRWLQQLAPDADWRHSRALATHPRIVDTAGQLGFGRVAGVAPRPQAVRAALDDEV